MEKRVGVSKPCGTYGPDTNRQKFMLSSLQRVWGLEILKKHSSNVMISLRLWRRQKTSAFHLCLFILQNKGPVLIFRTCVSKNQAAKAFTSSLLSNSWHKQTCVTYRKTCVGYYPLCIGNPGIMRKVKQCFGTIKWAPIAFPTKWFVTAWLFTTLNKFTAQTWQRRWWFVSLLLLDEVATIPRKRTQHTDVLLL